MCRVSIHILRFSRNASILQRLSLRGLARTIQIHYDLRFLPHLTHDHYNSYYPTNISSCTQLKPRKQLPDCELESDHFLIWLRHFDRTTSCFATWICNQNQRHHWKHKTRHADEGTAKNKDSIFLVLCNCSRRYNLSFIDTCSSEKTGKRNLT